MLAAADAAPAKRGLFEYIRQKKCMSTIIALAGTIFFFYTAQSSLFNAIPSMLLHRECDRLGYDPDSDACKDDKGAASQASRLYSYYQLAGGLASVLTIGPSSVFSDAKGRKPMIMLQFVAAALNMLVTYLLPVSAIFWLFVTNAATHLAGGQFALVAAVFSSVADISHDATPEMKGQMQSLVAGCQWTGLTVGPFLGGLMMREIGPRRVFLGVTSIFCLGLLWAIVFYRETLKRENRLQTITWKSTNVVSSIRTLGATPLTVRLGALLALLYGSTIAVMAVIPFFFSKRMNWDSFEIGIFQSVQFSAFAVGLLVIFPLVQPRLGLNHSLLLSALWTGACAAAYGFAQHPWQAFALASLNLFNSAFFPVLRSAIANVFGSRRFGVAIGGLATLQGVMATFVGPAFSQLYSLLLELDVQWSIFLFCALLNVAAGVIIFFLPPLEHVKSLEEESALAAAAGQESGDTVERHYQALLDPEENLGVAADPSPAVVRGEKGSINQM